MVGGVGDRVEAGVDVDVVTPAVVADEMVSEMCWTRSRKGKLAVSKHWVVLLIIMASEAHYHSRSFGCISGHTAQCHCLRFRMTSYMHTWVHRVLPQTLPCMQLHEEETLCCMVLHIYLIHSSLL